MLTMHCMAFNSPSSGMLSTERSSKCSLYSLHWAHESGQAPPAGCRPEQAAAPQSRCLSPACFVTQVSPAAHQAAALQSAYEAHDIRPACSSNTSSSPCCFRLQDQSTVVWALWKLVQHLRSHELKPCARGGCKAGLRAIQDAQQRMHALCSNSIGCCSSCPQLLVQQQLPHLA
jgi:hypothetical protein